MQWLAAGGLKGARTTNVEDDESFFGRNHSAYWGSKLDYKKMNDLLGIESASSSSSGHGPSVTEDHVESDHRAKRRRTTSVSPIKRYRFAHEKSVDSSDFAESGTPGLATSASTSTLSSVTSAMTPLQDLTNRCPETSRCETACQPHAFKRGLRRCLSMQEPRLKGSGPRVTLPVNAESSHKRRRTESLDALTAVLDKGFDGVGRSVREHKGEELARKSRDSGAVCATPKRAGPTLQRRTVQSRESVRKNGEASIITGPNLQDNSAATVDDLDIDDFVLSEETELILSQYDKPIRKF